MGVYLIRTIKNVSEITHKFGTYILIPIMVTIIALDVILRYIFNAPLVWGQEVNGIFLFILLFACQSHCWDKNHHIRMDVFYNHFPSAIKKISDILTALAGISFFGLMCLQAIRDIPYMKEVNETSDELRIILWPFRAVMVYCCLLIVVLLIAYLFRTHSRSRNAEEVLQ